MSGRTAACQWSCAEARLHRSLCLCRGSRERLGCAWPVHGISLRVFQAISKVSEHSSGKTYQHAPVVLMDQPAGCVYIVCVLRPALARQSARWSVAQSTYWSSVSSNVDSALRLYCAVVTCWILTSQSYPGRGQNQCNMMPSHGARAEVQVLTSRTTAPPLQQSGQTGHNVHI